MEPLSKPLSPHEPMLPHAWKQSHRTSVVCAGVLAAVLWWGLCIAKNVGWSWNAIHTLRNAIVESVKLVRTDTAKMLWLWE